MARPIWTVLALCLAPALGAQGTGTRPPIADNSFLMEEAYNQERGVVQHISVFQKLTDASVWSYTFTQEWPVFGQRNQFSYSIPFLGNDPHSGIGDMMLNWRYQLIGRDNEATWISPRASVIIPTGDDGKGLGSGSTGFDVAIPISHRWGPHLVSHTNVGFTTIPDIEATTVSLGQSVIWQPRARTNFMIEGVWRQRSVDAGTGSTVTSTEAYISPGIRWAYDRPSGLQVVPGVAFPIGIGHNHDTQVLLYLSLEHPFRR